MGNQEVDYQEASKTLFMLVDRSPDVSAFDYDNLIAFLGTDFRDKSVVGNLVNVMNQYLLKYCTNDSSRVTVMMQNLLASKLIPEVTSELKELAVMPSILSNLTQFRLLRPSFGEHCFVIPQQPWKQTHLY